MNNEISILQDINNEHVVKLIESFEDDDNLYLVLEYC